MRINAEGIKALKKFKLRNISIGDYVLYGSELLVVAEIYRVPPPKAEWGFLLHSEYGTEIEAWFNDETELHGINGKDFADFVLAQTAPKEFVVKDSGQRQSYSSGMVRDTQDGKPDYTLLDSEFLQRWAAHMTLGAVKYGRDNWRKADSEEELQRFQSSAFRHFMSWIKGEVDEDHAVAVAFNIAAAEYVKERLKKC